MRSPTILFGLVALAITITTQARADGRSVPNSSVQLEIAGRTGEAFVVEVTNPSDVAAPFDSIGLYFVPDSSDEPQRLGVVSAPSVAAPGGEWVAAQEVITVAPHQTIRLRLTAYCLDEEREGPNETTPYHLAGRRIPTALADALAGAAQSATREHGDPQKAVWAVRSKMPATLLGERH